MKKYTGLLCFLSLALTGGAQGLNDAENAFQKGDFATAKNQYSQFLQKATGNEKLQAQLRLAACEFHLGEFLNAAKTMRSYPLPQDPVWQARFLLYRIYTAQQASGIYRRILNKNEILSAQAAEDPEQWTHEQWQEKIDQDYRQLWSLRTKLANTPIEQENLILNLTNTDTKRIPTLFDFTVNSWIAYLQNHSSANVEPLSADVPSFLGGQARLKESPRKKGALLHSQILQEAANLEGKNRQNARLFWLTDLVLLPFNNDNFVLENDSKALDNALAQLRPQITNPSAQTNWLGRLKNRVSASASPQPDYARGYTAWQLATVLNKQKRYNVALEVTHEAESLSSSYFTAQCSNLAKNITRVDLSATSNATIINRTQPELSISGKNLKQVFVRVYKTSFEELTNLYNKRRKRNGTFDNWNGLTRLTDQDISSFLTRTPKHQQTVSVPYQGVGQAQNISFNLPALEEGFYVVLMSTQEKFSPETNGVFGWVVNATDLSVFASAAISGDPADYVATTTASPKRLNPDVFHIYTVNLRTGQPQPNTPLRLLTGWNSTPSNAKTDNNGIYNLARTITISNQRTSNENYTLDVLAQAGNSTAYLANPLHFYFYTEEPVKLFLQTDRPIYRPGQKAYVSIQGFERLPRGLKTLSGSNVSLTVTDPNGKKVFTSSPRLDGLGNAQVNFTLPENTLLGNYSISATINLQGRTYRAHRSFSLEEYKRPDYELVLDALQSPLVYGKKAVLSGTAKYYFGAPMEKVKVTYTLKRYDYVPPFYWWWLRIMFPAEEKIIAQGQTTTNDKGTFEVSFTPTRQEEDEEFANYKLEAQVFDESGRAISATRSYKISAHPHLFKVTFTQGFYDANKTAPLAKINLVDADGNPVSGKIALTVSMLENRQPKTQTIALPSDLNTNLDILYKDFTAKKTVLQKQLSFQNSDEQTLQLPALSEGVYRLELASEKAAPQKMVFIVANEKSNLQLPDVALVQHPTYHPGEVLRVLLGAGNLHGSKQVEIYQQDKFLTHHALLSGGVEVFRLPLTPNHRGGVALRWFGASDYQLHTAQTSAQVPFDNKKLTVQTTIPATVKPGQPINWELTVKDADGKPVNGLINATVYDKSLDYYAKNNLPFQFSSLYSQHTGLPQLAPIPQGAYTLAYYPKRTSSWSKGNDPLQLPSINLQMMHRAYADGAVRGGLMMAKSAAPMAAVEESLSFSQDLSTNQSLEEASLADEKSIEGETKESKTEDSSLRTDFSETAYFNSSLPLTNGQASLRFTLPQSLTTWNILGFALTKQADFGDFNVSTIARKDVMVRLQLPRFYREGDKGVIQAAVTNQTNQKITAQVNLTLLKDKISALSAFGITQPVQTVTVPANSTRFASWDITAPADPALYTLTAVVRNGRESDGEQKTLPILPGKMRLLAATHRALKNGNNTLALGELNSVPSQDVELVALTLNPSLALSVLNSVPNLLSSPHNDLVSSLNRYVPLAVVNKFYTTYPQLKEAVKKLPKRTGLTPAWNEQDPLRLQLLEQTPWLREAQGRQARQADIISLFDDKLVTTYLEKELKNINRFQNASGAFSWFPGGPDDDYLTLYALQSFAQALAYKATIPQQPAKKALDYILPRIEKNLKQDKSGSVAAVSYALYAAYTLSAFPANWEQSSRAKSYIKRWVDYADSQFKFMTPLGQIYAAAVYHRLGDDVKANKYLDLVLARLKTDPLTGAYFAPEAQSWVWYNDTLTTQTITLRTLLEMRPQSDKISPMMQWLLFNRQVNDWTNSKATSQAVFTLLDVMQAKGALSTASSYQINWGGQTQTRTFEPLDWTEDLQFVRQEKQITPATYTAQINRQGPDTTDFASLTAIYQSAQAQSSPKGVINVERAYFLREKQGTQVKLRPLTQEEALHAADEVEVHLTLHTDSAFEYVLLQDPKPAGFESPNLRSGWVYQNVSFYREEKEAVTNFFISWVPRGTLTLHYTLQPTVAGKLHALPAQVQSMYAPEYGAHSASTSFTVEK